VAFVGHLGHGFQKSGGNAFVPDFEKFDNGFLPASSNSLFEGVGLALGWTPFSNQQELKISYGMRV
jgi:hypothetical protein